ncbi:MAG: P22 phage major capsid protein family protein [Candidatus Omnitrophica bacterium]|nr:P22 phage major capsid protein family protein [Candidatus Omnitrophota bacterium]
MAIDNFIPEIWANEYLRALDKALVFAQPGVINRDYEGDISQAGDTVRINEIGKITVKAYTKNGTIDAPETLTGAQQTLEITEADYFNFEIDDIDKAQQKPKLMQGAMSGSAQEMRDTIDQFIAGMYTGAAAANLIGTTAAPKHPNNTAGSDENIFKLVTLCRQALVKSNVPSGGWWMIVPPELYTVMLNDDRFSKADVSGTTMGLRNGQVGNISGFTVMESNNVEYIEDGDGSHDVYKVMFGTSQAITFASQIAKVEPFRPEDSFSDAVKGLQLYGGKVIRPECLGVLSCYA